MRAFVLAIILPVIAACEQRANTAVSVPPPSGYAWCRSAEWPSDCSDKVVEIARASSARKWDRVIELYNQLLAVPSVKASDDLQAEVYASLADAYMAKSNGKDISADLLLLARAASCATSPSLRKALAQQLRGTAVAVGHPEIAGHFEDTR